MPRKLLPDIPSEDIEGVRLLQTKRYQDAISFFQKRLDAVDSFAHYGLATALFLLKHSSMNVNETKDVICHYNKAIDSNPELADAYFMCGLAYEQLASALIREYKKEPYANAKQRIDEMKIVLTLGKQMLERSVILNSNFGAQAESELKSFAQRIKGVEALRKYYQAQKASFN
ncbi:MAG: hypothetical protein WC299_04670 [Kiritimatiellia bacterium]